MKLLVVGSAIVDLIAQPISTVRTDASNEATITWSAGGSGRNVAENLARLGADVTFITDAGTDALGEVLLAQLRDLAVDVRLARRERTGVYLAVLDRGGVLDRGYCQTGTEFVSVDEVLAVLPDLDRFDGAVFDANLRASVIERLGARCRSSRIPYALETTAHVRSLRVAGALAGCAFIKPDRGEAEVLTGLPCSSVDEAKACASQLRARGADRVAVSLGCDGLIFADESGCGHFAALPTEVVDVTGAGDALLAAVFLGCLTGLPRERAIAAGLRAAALACRTRGATHSGLSPDIFNN